MNSIIKIGVFLIGTFCVAKAWPSVQNNQCNFLQAYPFFRNENINQKEMTTLTRAELKSELTFLTEFARFMNKKAPILLQEFAESKKIFETKKKLGLIELESNIRRSMMSGSGSRMTRSASIDEGQVSITPEDEFKMLARFMSKAEAADNDEERQEETTDNPTNSIEDIGESAGELAQQIVSTLTGSAQDVIGLFQEIVSSVGDVLKDTLPPSTWQYLCIATWYPLHEEHCTETRCAACTPAVMSASAVCRKTGNAVNHKCIQKVMGEGFCNFCISEFI